MTEKKKKMKIQMKHENSSLFKNILSAQAERAY